MSKIEIYARIRPTHRPFEGLTTSQNHVSVQIGRLRDGGAVERFTSAPGARHDFRFSRTFHENSTQCEVFETVARKIVDRFVEGYNGTVFAYGQTSTGKTYTVEGSVGGEGERGLVPRTLSYLYPLIEEKKKKLLMKKRSQIEEKNHQVYSTRTNTPQSERELEGGGVKVRVHISYMEIYQDTGYDLLNPGARPGSLMLTLPKVQISETPDGRVMVRDLSVHEAPTEEQALQLLLKGSACRKVAETAMNQSSSRSHSIFTITMTTKQPGSEVVVRSKLNLVDLAGSERVAKTGSDGRILQEAKYINLSLHHLEHVIVSLQKQARSGGEGRGHIPYRNSMLTMVLRDSLGGNCLTAMIATVSAEGTNILETISTLRFSQRVACISNRARRNEELDDKAVIRKLKRRVVELERELISIKENKCLPPQLSMASDGEGMGDSEKQLCHRVLYDFFHGRVSNPVEAGINTPALFRECLQVLREIVIDAVKSSTTATASATPIDAHPHRHAISADKVGKVTASPSHPHTLTPPSKSHLPSSISTPSRNSHPHTSHSQVSHPTHPTSKKSTLTPSPIPRTHTITPHTLPSPPSSPGSRLSSGIGSLHDDTDDKQHTPVVSRSHTQPTTWARRVLRTHMVQSSDKSAQFSSDSHMQPTRRVVNTQMISSSLPSSSSLLSQSQLQSQKKPEMSARRLVHTQMIPSSPSSSQSQLELQSHTEPATWARSVVHTHNMVSSDKSLSTPRVPASLQKSREKSAQLHATSRVEEERMSDGIQILSLRVQQEDLRTQLENVSELLARQRARLLGYQQRERVAVGNKFFPGDDDLANERLVEQQLRIRQARLNQKLLSVQQQIKSLRLPTETFIPMGKPLATSPSIGLTELERELQMKEAATRKKMEKLRKQLTSSAKISTQQLDTANCLTSSTEISSRSACGVSKCESPLKSGRERGTSRAVVACGGIHTQENQRCTVSSASSRKCAVRESVRQKGRVMQIRRCVAAATTIQRVWRTHRDRRLSHMNIM